MEDREMRRTRNGRLNTLQENLIRCYDQKLYVDVVVRIRDRIFQAHRNILSFYSPIFQKAFYETEIPSSVCIINDIEPGGFDILLRFLYSSQVPDEANADDLEEACYAAQVLQMEGIQEKLVNHILFRNDKRISSKTIAEMQFWPLLKKFRSLTHGILREKLLKFAESHFKSVVDSGSFDEADVETIKLVFDRKPPCLPERYILESIARWKKSNDHLVSSDKPVRDLLDCVNFKRLSPKEFYAVASKHDCLLSNKDSLDILMHLVDPTVCPLPEWYHFDDKWWDAPINRKTESKTDTLKSPNVIWTTNNFSPMARDWGKWKRAFSSQEGLRKIDYAEKIEEWDEEESNTKATASGKTLQESFCQMLEEGLFTDVTLIAKDETRFPAHRLVLALGNKLFADVFYETAPASASSTFRIEETAEEVKDMLRYFYGCGDISVFDSSPDSVLRKATLASKYLCYPMIQVCDDALSRMSLNSENFWKLTDWVDRVSHSKVDTEALMKYASTSTKEIFEHDSFLSASRNSLVKVLKRDDLNMAESDILEYVARWLERNAEVFSNYSSRREILENIRFESLSTKQFYAFLNKHGGLFSARDAFAIMKFHYLLKNRRPGRCLSNVFYQPSSKIGTEIPVSWSSILKKGTRFFSCRYEVAIRGKHIRSEIQFLEFLLKIKLPRVGQCSSYCTYSVIIEPDDGSDPVMFRDLKAFPQQRYLLPVSICLDDLVKPKVRFILKVQAKHQHRLYTVNERCYKFENVVLEMTDGSPNCLCDAIVDGMTSENYPIPPSLLSRNRNAAIETEKFLKITSEPLS